MLGYPGHRSSRTVHDANDIMPVWSPDGGRVLFASDRDEQRQRLFQKHANSASAEELVLDLKTTSTVPYAWSPDGRFIPSARSPVGPANPLFRARLAGGPTTTVGFTAQYDVTRDGRFLLNVPVAEPPRAAMQVVLNRAAVSAP